MHYVVPDMKLIPQDKNMSCWYASGQMLIAWRQRTTQMSELVHPDPSLVEKWGKLYDKNTGISNELIMSFANDLGLEAVAPQTPTAGAINNWLVWYGPLWVNGKFHITVIAGVRDTSSHVEVLVYDPALPHKKHGEWRDLVAWYLLDPHSGRDTSDQVRTVFLHLPVTNWAKMP
jgi:papain like cysteine protease AvrRpt2